MSPKVVGQKLGGSSRGRRLFGGKLCALNRLWGRNAWDCREGSRSLGQERMKGRSGRWGRLWKSRVMKVWRMRVGKAGSEWRSYSLVPLTARVEMSDRLC